MLRIRLLGGLELESDGVQLARPPGRPATALLSWLATHPGRHTRAGVAAALWPGVLDTSARGSLRTGLAILRRSLGAAAEVALPTEDGQIGLAAAPLVVVDVHEVEELLAAGRLEQALAMTGELLPELDDDWVLDARDRHRDRQADAMAKLADRADAEGDEEAAVAWSRRRTELAPYDEPAHRALITRMARAGNPGGAIVVYERFAERLRRQLATAPSLTTRELVALLRAESAPSPARERALASPGWLHPLHWRGRFVGRNDALARLRDAWAAARSGEFAVAVVLGEPGIGKTRLAAQLAVEARADGATVLGGRAEAGSARPLQAIRQAMGPGGADPFVAPTGSSDDQAARVRWHEQLAEELERAARGHPLLLVLDDLHWADSSTLDVLRHLAARPRGLAALVLATARGRSLGALAPLEREVGLTRVILDGLSQADTAALVGADARDLDALLRRTRGNPFFLESLADAGLTALGARIPTDVAELVGARLDPLGPDVAALLEAGALFGREFELALAATTAGLTTDAALVAGDAAVNARLLVPSTEVAGRFAFHHDLVLEALSARPSPGRKARLHARALEAITPRAEAGGIEPMTAAAQHAIAAIPVVDVAVAARLAHRAGLALAPVNPAEAAHLLARAADLADTAGEADALRGELRCALGAALHAADRPADAGAAFRSAVEHARRTDDGALLARAALGLAGPAVTILRVRDDVVACLEEALARLPADAAVLRARVQARMAIELAYDADARARDAHSVSALKTARASTDPTALAAALGARHVVLWGPDHTVERLALADEMCAVAQRAGDAALELQARSWRIVDLSETGNGTLLDRELDVYAATATRSRLSSYGWWVPAWRAARAFLAGRANHARDLQRQATALAHAAGDANGEFVDRQEWVLWLADERAEVLDVGWQEERMRSSPAAWAYRALYTTSLAARGRESEARQEIDALRDAGGPSSWPRDTNWLSATKQLAEAAAILNDRALGQELESLLTPLHEQMVTNTRALICLGSVAGGLARLAELAGDPSRAIARYREAVERDTRASAAIWAMHDRRRLGAVLMADGQREEGDALLDRVAREAPRLGLPHLAELSAKR